LADYQAHLEKLARDGIRVAAASAESADEADKMVQEHGLGFPVGCGLDPQRVSSLVGAFYEPGEGGYLHATGFLVEPGGAVKVACYSSGPIGRLQADNLRKLVEHYQSQE
jgi:peroxiredoxin